MGSSEGAGAQARRPRCSYAQRSGRRGTNAGPALIDQISSQGDLTIKTRARMAERLTSLVEVDPRVIRCSLIEFADDGGVLVGVDFTVEQTALPGMASLASWSSSSG